MQRTNCKICFKKFESKKRLDEHVTLHSSTSKKYECYICKSICSYYGGMVIHMRKHTKDKPFSCDFDQCPYQCTTLSSLVKHKIVHSTEALFVCDQCPKAFKRSESLRSHKFTHALGRHKNKKHWIRVPVEAID